MKGFYYVINRLRQFLSEDLGIQSFTNGNMDKIIDRKQWIYPYAHIMVNSVSPEEQVSTFNVSVILMDIVDQSKAESTDTFEGNDNELDVLDTQLTYAIRLSEQLRRGTLYSELVQVEGNISCEPFTDRFEDAVAGWVITFDLIIPNEMTVCNGFEKC